MTGHMTHYTYNLWYCCCNSVRACFSPFGLSRADSDWSLALVIVCPRPESADFSRPWIVVFVPSRDTILPVSEDTRGSCEKKQYARVTRAKNDILLLIFNFLQFLYFLQKHIYFFYANEIQIRFTQQIKINCKLDLLKHVENCYGKMWHNMVPWQNMVLCSTILSLLKDKSNLQNKMM